MQGTLRGTVILQSNQRDAAHRKMSERRGSSAVHTSIVNLAARLSVEAPGVLEHPQQTVVQYPGRNGREVTLDVE